MKKLIAIGGAVLLGLFTVWGYVMDAKDSYEILPERIKDNIIAIPHKARGLLQNAPRAVGQSVTKARQTLGAQKLGAIEATSAIREHMPDLYRKQKGRDALCKNPLPNLYVGIPWRTRKLNPRIQVDHKFPSSKGGTDHISNLQLTRAEYNRAKSDKTGLDLEQALLAICPN